MDEANHQSGSATAKKPSNPWTEKQFLVAFIIALITYLPIHVLSAFFARYDPDRVFTQADMALLIGSAVGGILWPLLIAGAVSALLIIKKNNRTKRTVYKTGFIVVCSFIGIYLFSWLTAVLESP